MIRKLTLAVFCALALASAWTASDARAEDAYGYNWSRSYNTQDWNRFYHYPYVYYPQNFWGSDYYRSAEHLYYRYPPEMRVPVYNKGWHNYYPVGRRWHSGHHFVLDVF